MKKILFFAALFLSNQAFSQTIPNNGFETWATSGPFLAPTGWAVSPGVKQSTQAHSGTYAIQCTVDTFTNPMTSTLDTIVGNAYSGTQTMGPPTPGADLIGYAFTAKPDSLTGFYKYRAMGPDSLIITVSISKWNTTTNSRDVVGKATFTNGTNDSVYKRFSTPIQYGASFTGTPDTCIIQIQPANPMAPRNMGTSVWVDDLAFKYKTTGIADVVIAGGFSTYPNPFTDVINIEETNGADVSQVSLINVAGQTVLTTTGKQLNTSKAPAGIYILNVVNSEGAMSSRKMIKL